MRSKHGGMIPVIVAMRGTASTAEKLIANSKFMVTPSLSFGHFRAFVRSKIRGLHSHESLFAFVGTRHALPSMSQPMALVYSEHRDDDGFLYVMLAKENTFG